MNRSLRSVAFAASPSSGVTAKISCKVRKSELLYRRYYQCAEFDFEAFYAHSERRGNNDDRGNKHGRSSEQHCGLEPWVAARCCRLRDHGAAIIGRRSEPSRAAAAAGAEIRSRR